MPADFETAFANNFETEMPDAGKAMARAFNLTIDTAISTMMPAGSAALFVTNLTSALGEAITPDGAKLATAAGIGLDTAQGIYVVSMAAFAAGTQPNPWKPGVATVKAAILGGVPDWAQGQPQELDPYLQTLAETIVDAYPSNVKPLPG